MARDTPLGMDFMNWQNAPSNSLGLVAGAYLANKMGLVDWNNPDQQQAIQKQGLLGTIIGNKLGMNTPANAVPPKIGAGGFGPNTDYSLSPVAPKLPNQMGQVPATPMSPDQQVSQLAPQEDDDSLFGGIAKFATMLG